MPNIIAPISASNPLRRANCLQKARRLGASIALILKFACVSATATAEPLEEIAMQLELWIDAHTDFERNDRSYKIRLVAELPNFMPKDAAMAIGNQTRGLYDSVTSTITLVQPWDPEDLDDQSVLLHELVHHRQSGKHYYCPAAKELAAYKLQEAWLTARGSTLDVNWVGVVLASSCTARDIHPD